MEFLRYYIVMPKGPQEFVGIKTFFDVFPENTFFGDSVSSDDVRVYFGEHRISIGFYFGYLGYSFVIEGKYFLARAYFPETFNPVFAILLIEARHLKLRPGGWLYDKSTSRTWKVGRWMTRGCEIVGISFVSFSILPIFISLSDSQKRCAKGLHRYTH